MSSSFEKWIIALLVGIFASLCGLGLIQLLNVSESRNPQPVLAAAPAPVPVVAPVQERKQPVVDAVEEKCVPVENKERKLTKSMDEVLKDNSLEPNVLRLISKFDEDACVKCTEKDLRLLVQLKMFDAIKRGNTKKIDEMLKKLDQSREEADADNR